MNDLVIIPARDGSKGIPGKNIKLLNSRPLIYYSIDAAIEVTEPKHICISTDSDEIIQVVRDYGIDVPFKRPTNLATDTAGSYDVVRHALDFYEKKGCIYNRIILLQPTSPFRTGKHIKEALALYQSNLDMVVSVRVSHSNPYFTLFEQNKDGYLKPSKTGNFSRRQDCPPVYEYNGAIYIINRQQFDRQEPIEFSHIVKYVMSEEDSIDIDTPLDWEVAESVIRRKIEY